MRIVLALFIFVQINLSGQSNFNTWNFGYNNALTFSGTEEPTQGFGPINVDEGSASISDSNGNLLFSTDGNFVFDRDGNPMPSASNIGGHFSSTQNAVIVPKPGDFEERFYFVFVVSSGGVSSANGGLSYVEIDMSLNNGLGDILSQPILIVPNVFEKVHASMHSNGKDVWVLTFDTSTSNFYSVLVTCEGVGSQVVSEVDLEIETNQWNNESVGMLKVSPNGQNLAMTWTVLPNFEAGLMLGDFDNMTGEIEMISSIVENQNEISRGYGLAFSSQSQFLYWTISFSGGSTLRRFDLTSADVLSTFEDYQSLTPYAMMALQLAPDGKIYVARSNSFGYLSRIESPDEPNFDNINFNEQGIELLQNSSLGLSNDWNYIPTYLPEEIQDVTFCDDSDKIIDASIFGASSYSWNTGSAASAIEIPEEGIYNVILNFDCFSYEVFYNVGFVSSPEYESPAELNICPGEEVSVTVETNSAVVWFDNDVSKSREFDSPGIYAYTVYNEHCTEEDQIAVNRVDPPSIFFEENQVVICEDQSVWLNPQVSNFDSLHWENGEVSQRILVENSGQFAVTAVNECGSVMAEIEVIEEECFCSIYIPNSFSPNGDGLNDVFKAVTDCEVTQFTLSVFDRWGKEVWSSSDIDESWRGGDSHFSKGDLYNYRYSAILNKNGKDYFRDGSGMISIIR